MPSAIFSLRSASRNAGEAHAGLMRPLRRARLARRRDQASFEPQSQACALFTIEPKKGLENELDGVRVLLGHDERVRGAAPAADISRAEQHAWSEWADTRKISPEAHGLTVTRG
jgi:hypothetical protein